VAIKIIYPIANTLHGSRIGVRDDTRKLTGLLRSAAPMPRCDRDSDYIMRRSTPSQWQKL